MTNKVDGRPPRTATTTSTPRPNPQWKPADTSRVKLYRRHRCTRKHRNPYVAIACMLPYAVRVDGVDLDPAKGGFVVLARCQDRWTISTWRTIQDAATAMEWIEYIGCGHQCYRDHEIIQIAPTDRLVGVARGGRR